MRTSFLKPVVIGLLPVLALLGACNERGDTEQEKAPVPLETPDHFLRFLNDQEGKVLSDEWTRAYYKVVDPFDERTTLEAWKATNGFGSCADEFHIIFRDAKDLGYGRDMYACKHSDGRFAVFVRNFIVKIFDGDPTNYGPINVEAAIEADLTHHVGSNAIEFSPLDPADPSSEKVAKFFTFTPDGARNLSADLDGRGKKPMPQPCLLCHGATLLPWDTDMVMSHPEPWTIPEVEQTIKSAKLNQLELDSFDYSSLYPSWSRSNQEERFRLFNGYVRETYMEIAERDDTVPGHWCADFAIELAVGRYGEVPDPITPATPCGAHNPVALSGNYQDGFIPTGWRQTASRPEGVEVLYKRVIEPHCIACHSLRGNAAGERAGAANATRAGNSINFNSYEEFIGYADIVKEYVFRRGAMPLSLRNYLDFWEDPDQGPAILASFLPGFDLYAADGSVVPPGKPVALPGAERTVKSPVQLDAGASYFARTYQWTVAEKPAGAVAVFSNMNSPAPLFYASQEGDYRLRLTVINNKGTDSEDLVLHIDQSLSPVQSELTFYDDIRPILQTPDPGQVSKREACTNCHSSATAPASALYKGIPVYYDDAVDDPLDATDRNLYLDVMARVDLDEPENSILLRKPTREQHGGGIVLDLDNPGHYESYQTIINWIRNGAPCGDDGGAGICP